MQVPLLLLLLRRRRRQRSVLSVLLLPLLGCILLQIVCYSAQDCCLLPRLLRHNRASLGPVRLSRRWLLLLQRHRLVHCCRKWCALLLLWRQRPGHFCSKWCILPLLLLRWCGGACPARACLLPALFTASSLGLLATCTLLLSVLQYRLLRSVVWSTMLQQTWRMPADEPSSSCCRCWRSTGLLCWHFFITVTQVDDIGVVV
jgi:hypothetical protein